MAATKKTKIKKDLLDQLERKGIYGSQYLDLVNDYMSLWDIKNKLIKDIKKRGVVVEWQNGPGQSGLKKNDSVGELKKINDQMLKILKALDLEPGDEVGDDDDEM